MLGTERTGDKINILMEYVPGKSLVRPKRTQKALQQPVSCLQSTHVCLFLYLIIIHLPSTGYSAREIRGLQRAAYTYYCFFSFLPFFVILSMSIHRSRIVACRQDKLSDVSPVSMNDSTWKIGKYTKQLVSALAFCHANNVVHRDIKVTSATSCAARLARY